MSWSRRFDEPIALPEGGELVTLRGAGNYIAGLPEKTTALPRWQEAARELMIAAEQDGMMMIAEIALRQALHHGRAAPDTARRKRAKRYRVVR